MQIKNLPAFIKTHRQTVMIIALLLGAAAVIALLCAMHMRKTVRVVVDNKIRGDGAQVTSKDVNVKLTSRVEDVLSDEGIVVDDHYNVNQDLGAMTAGVNEIKIVARVSGTVHVGGKDIRYDSSAETVGDLLQELGIKTDRDDAVIPGTGTKLTTDLKDIQIKRAEYLTVSHNEIIAPPKEQRVNPDKLYGTADVLDPGVPGTKVVTEKIATIDGAEVNREVIKEVVTTKPVAQVEEIGAKLEKGGVISTGHSTAELSDADFDLLCAVVRQEAGTDYEGNMAVISCIMNRVDQGRGDVMTVIKAAGQFAAYFDGAYQQYTNGAYPETTRKAVEDCVKGGLRSHNYVNFRSYPQTDEPSFEICGNWYF